LVSVTSVDAESGDGVNSVPFPARRHPSVHPFGEAGSKKKKKMVSLTSFDAERVGRCERPAVSSSHATRRSGIHRSSR
jgi:hypothetical protein